MSNRFAIARIRNCQTQYLSRSGLWVKFAITWAMTYPTWETAHDACNDLVIDGKIGDDSFVVTVTDETIRQVEAKLNAMC